jgi:hypothetical protein
LPHYTDPNLSYKLFIIIDKESELKDNSNLINNLIQNKQVYLICLAPVDVHIYLKGNFFYSNFYEYSFEQDTKRINPFTIDINSNLWVELVNIGSFLKTNEHKNKINNVCIAWCSEELSSYRKLLASELQHNGYSVVLLNYDENENNLMSKFSSCEYMIHPFGSHKSDKLYLNGLPSDRFQMEVAADFSNKYPDSKMKRFVWEMPEKNKVDDENQAYLLNLASNKYLLQNAEYLKIDFSKFKTILISDIKRREIDSLYALQHSKSIVNILCIYQDSDNREMELASKIKYNLSPGIHLINLPDTYITLRRFRSYLVDAEVVIVFYFEENAKWLNSKLIEIIKAPGYGRSKKWIAKYLVTTDKSIIEEPELVENFEIISLNEINFLHKLQTDIENYRIIERNRI